MKSGAIGILTGALALIALQVTLTASQNSSSGASSVLSLAQYPVQLAQRWMSPAQPLIPQTETKTTSSSNSSGAAASNNTQLATLGQPT